MAALQYSCLANPHRQRSLAGFSLQGLKELDVTEVTQHALMHQLDILMLKGFPDGSVGKETVHNAGDPGLIPELERSPGEGNGNPLQYCLGNPMDRGNWWAIVHGVTKELDTTQRLKQTKQLLETSRAFKIFVRIIFMRSLELIWLRAVICGMPSWRTRTAFSFRVGFGTRKLKG